jgi:hypothetical protein
LPASAMGMPAPTRAAREARSVARNFSIDVSLPALSTAAEGGA